MRARALDLAGRAGGPRRARGPRAGRARARAQRPPGLHQLGDGRLRGARGRRRRRRGARGWSGRAAPASPFAGTVGAGRGACASPPAPSCPRAPTRSCAARTPRRPRATPSRATVPPPGRGRSCAAAARTCARGRCCCPPATGWRPTRWRWSPAAGHAVRARACAARAWSSWGAATRWCSPAAGPAPGQVFDSNRPGIAAQARAAGRRGRCACCSCPTTCAATEAALREAPRRRDPAPTCWSRSAASRWAATTTCAPPSRPAGWARCSTASRSAPATRCGWASAAGSCVLGLPGNPVSAAVCFHAFGRELLGVARRLGRADAPRAGLRQGDAAHRAHALPRDRTAPCTRCRARAPTRSPRSPAPPTSR